MLKHKKNLEIIALSTVCKSQRFYGKMMKKHRGTGQVTAQKFVFFAGRNQKKNDKTQGFQSRE